MVKQGHSRSLDGTGCVCNTHTHTHTQVSKIKGVVISDILVSSLSFPYALLKGQDSSPTFASLTY